MIYEAIATINTPLQSATRFFVYLALFVVFLCMLYLFLYIARVGWAGLKGDNVKTARIIKGAARVLTMDTTGNSPTMLDGAYFALEAKEYQLADELATLAGTKSDFGVAPHLLRIYIALVQNKMELAISHIAATRTLYDQGVVPIDIDALLGKAEQAANDTSAITAIPELLVYKEKFDRIRRKSSMKIIFSIGVSGIIALAFIASVLLLKQLLG